MEVSQQETVFLPQMPNNQESPFGASFLRFDSFKSTSNSDDNPSSPAVSPCNCNCSSAKRPYPEPTADRFPKKPNNNPDSPGNFLNLSLSPISTTTSQSFPSLRRCVSDPYTPPRSLPKFPLPKNPLSPLSRRRSLLSSPSPEKAFSRSSSSNKIITEESLNHQRWQRMKDRLKEMNEWLDEMREGEELKVTETEIPVKEDDVFVPNGGEEEEEEGGGTDEAVWVEKTKECLTLHFKCPCGKDYQILLADGKCYYKLL